MRSGFPDYSRQTVTECFSLASVSLLYLVHEYSSTVKQRADKWDIGTELEKVILISTLTFLWIQVLRKKSVTYNHFKLQQNCVGHPFGKKNGEFE